MKTKLVLGAAVVMVVAAFGGATACTNLELSQAPESGDAQESAQRVAALYEPQVIELDDGTLVQRTPTEYGGDNMTVLDGSYSYAYEQDYPVNTYYMHADERGCSSCHESLIETLNNGGWRHANFTNSFGIEMTVSMCIDCHTFGYGYITNQRSFGDLIHGIHEFSDAEITCSNCHVQTDGEYLLWDLEKHNMLRGITAVADVEGEFSWNQDKTTPAEEIFDYDWRYYDNDYMRAEMTAANADPDQELFNSWTVTVSGNVENELTYTLPELIELFGSEVETVTFQCTLNATGGPYIANATYTGVNVRDLLNAAGVDWDNFGGLIILSSDGFIEAVNAENFEDAWLAYEVDGEPLPWSQGYPVQMVVSHSAAPSWVKEVSDIVVMTPEESVDYKEWNGWPKETEGTDYYTPGNWPFTNDNGYQNKPNIGLFDNVEGRIVTTGEPYTFSGYAHAWDEQIVGIEFSMDGGVTWTGYDTSASDKKNWVIWNFTYTPETDSAYVLMIRAVTDTGMVTADPIEIMINAKSN